MNWKAIRRPLLVAAVGAMVGAAPTAAGQVGRDARQSKPCPERAAAQCEYVPSRPGAAPFVKPATRPQPAVDSRGRSVWRAGRWIME